MQRGPSLRGQKTKEPARRRRQVAGGLSFSGILGGPEQNVSVGPEVPELDVREQRRGLACPDESVVKIWRLVELCSVSDTHILIDTEIISGMLMIQEDKRFLASEGFEPTDCFVAYLDIIWMLPW